MSLFRDYQYNSTQVTATCTDTTNGNYVWIAFAYNNGACILKKVSAYDCSQVYFTVSVPVASINAMVVANSQIFLAVTPLLTGSNTSLFCLAYSVTNPLTTFTTLNFPSGVVESPVAIAVGASLIYFLTPGNLSGTAAKIIAVTTSNVFSVTITMQVSAVFVHHASAITVATGTGDIWVATNQSPVQLIRCFLVTSVYHFAETTL